MQAQNLKRNIERMEESVSGMKYDPSQHFISDAKWDHRAVYDSLIEDSDSFFDGHEDTCLAIDETYFQKKGKKSAGVSRQWNGRLGKVENSQVGVFASIVRDNESIVVGAELYLPKEWTEDKKRCAKAKVPEDAMEFKTKPELALDLIDRCLEKELRFHWVTADGGYGNNGKFLRAIDERNLTFMIDVHGKQKFYLNFPTDLRDKEERKKDPLELTTEPLRANSYAASLEDSQWKKVLVRNSTKGQIYVDLHEVGVYIWDEKERQPHRWKLVVTRDHNTKKDVKYSLTNAHEFTPKAKLAYMQRQRYWIEYSFGVMKSTCGLSDYQVRSWIGWHHHVAMVMLANQFIVEEQRESPEGLELLSANDIRELLQQFLPSKKTDEQELFKQMRKRHLQRLSSINQGLPASESAKPFDIANVPK